jgi:hypothetical protein
MRFVALAAMVLVGLSTSARCDAPKPEALPAAVSVLAYGEKNPACLEWSDGCVTCARGAGDAKSCSTPGVACQPGDIVCKRASK